MAFKRSDASLFSDSASSVSLVSFSFNVWNDWNDWNMRQRAGAFVVRYLNSFSPSPSDTLKGDLMADDLTLSLIASISARHRRRENPSSSLSKTTTRCAGKCAGRWPTTTKFVKREIERLHWRFSERSGRHAGYARSWLAAGCTGRRGGFFGARRDSRYRFHRQGRYCHWSRGTGVSPERTC